MFTSYVFARVHKYVLMHSVYIVCRIFMILISISSYLLGWHAIVYMNIMKTLHSCIYVTGFTKTVPIGTRNEVHFIAYY